MTSVSMSSVFFPDKIFRQDSNLQSPHWNYIYSVDGTQHYLQRIIGKCKLKESSGYEVVLPFTQSKVTFKGWSLHLATEPGISPQKAFGLVKHNLPLVNPFWLFPIFRAISGFPCCSSMVSLTQAHFDKDR